LVALGAKVTESYGGWGLADRVGAVQTALRRIADDVESGAAEVAERLRARNQQGERDAAALSAKTLQCERLASSDGAPRRLLRDSAVRWREEESRQGRRIAADLALVAARAADLRRASAALQGRLQEAAAQQLRLEARLVTLAEVEEHVAGQIAGFAAGVAEIRTVVAAIRALHRELQS
jgi:chromosome segregation ATPase